MKPFYDAETFRPRTSLGYLFRRINKLGASRVEAQFDSRDTNFTQWVVLALIANGVADTSAALSRDLCHNSGAMTRVLDQLEERGLIVRTPDEADRRVTKLAVTPAGDETMRARADGVMNVWNEILEGFDHDEIRQLTTTLGKLLSRLEELENEVETLA